MWPFEEVLLLSLGSGEGALIWVKPMRAAVLAIIFDKGLAPVLKARSSFIAAVDQCDYQLIIFDK